jgi:hypothetical protein
MTDGGVEVDDTNRMASFAGGGEVVTGNRTTIRAKPLVPNCVTKSRPDELFNGSLASPSTYDLISYDITRQHDQLHACAHIACAGDEKVVMIYFIFEFLHVLPPV